MPVKAQYFEGGMQLDCPPYADRSSAKTKLAFADPKNLGKKKPSGRGLKGVGKNLKYLSGGNHVRDINVRAVVRLNVQNVATID